MRRVTIAMRRGTTVLYASLLLICVAALSACGGDVTAGNMSGEGPAEDTGELPALVDRAIEAGNLQTLTTAITKAGLDEQLKGNGRFTLFAPDDEAFAALPAGSLDKLMADPKGKLDQVVRYHVLPEEVTSAQLTDGMKLKTLQGGTLTVSVDDDGHIKIDDATLVTGDIFASNGVIHIIDAVLLPPEKK